MYRFERRELSGTTPDMLLVLLQKNYEPKAISRVSQATGLLLANSLVLIDPRNQNKQCNSSTKSYYFIEQK